MVSRMLLLFCCVQAGIGVITDKELKKKLGINPASLKKVSWKDWVNKNGQVPWVQGPGPINCEPGIIAGRYRACCNKTTDCQKPGTVRGSLVCTTNGMCDCNQKYFYFSNANNTACEYRRKRELDESCTQLDYCHVAYADCYRRKCVCKDGFFQLRGLCYPKTYDCPYGLPLVSNGQLPICNPNSSSPCPNGYSCLEIIKNLDFAVVRTQPFDGYCCPNVPDITAATIDPFRTKQRFYGDVCFFGKPQAMNSTGNCPEGHYRSPGLGLGPTCCPTPCLIAPATVNNGKCTYPHNGVNSRISCHEC